MAYYSLSDTTETEDEESTTPILTSNRSSNFKEAVIPLKMVRVLIIFSVCFNDFSNDTKRKLRHVVGIIGRNIRTKFDVDQQNYSNDTKTNNIDLTDIRSENISEPQGIIPFPPISAHKLIAENNKAGTEKHIKVSHHRRSIRDLSSEYDSGLGLQQYLQATFSKRILSTFITIHVKNQDDPVYVSEIFYESTNPYFSDIDLTGNFFIGEETCYLISIWGKSKIDNNYSLITSEAINLCDLTYIGGSITNFKINFPPNSFIISFRDGYYILPKLAAVLFQEKSLNIENYNEINTDLKSNLSFATDLTDSLDSYQLSLSFDAMMKISNLHACVSDASNTVREAEKHINEFLIIRENLFLLRKRLNTLKSKHDIIEKRKKFQILRSVSTRQNIKQILYDMKSCQDSISFGENRQKTVRSSSSEIINLISADNIVIKDTLQKAFHERCRIMKDLSFIFPLKPIPRYLLKFTICGIPLLNNNASDENDGSNIKISQLMKDELNLTDEDIIGAAYGFASQLVLMMSYYLGTTLRYPIQPFGSQSFIIDPISSIQGSRTFPLWTKGSLYFRFQYATFLFNKNVEQLLNTQGLKTADVSQVLANLKNLMLVLVTE